MTIGKRVTKVKRYTMTFYFKHDADDTGELYIVLSRRINETGS